MELSSWELRPVSSSRNWEDFEEEEEEERPESIISYTWNGSGSGSGSGSGTVVLQRRKVVFIGISDAARTFLNAQFPSKVLVAKVLVPTSGVVQQQQSEIPREGASIYELQDYGVGIVCCSDDIPAHHFASLLACLFAHVESESVVILSSLQSSYYKPSDRFSVPSPPFLRQLQTTTQKLAVCPPLEAPNMIEGLPAACLSFCETRSMPAALFVSLQDSAFTLGKHSLAAYEPLLRAVLPSYPARDTKGLYDRYLQSREAKFTSLYL